jgi:hypothetical protein
MSSRLMPPKEGPERPHRIDERVDISGVDLEIDGIHIGETLEQDSLAFHHRFGCQRPKIAQSKNGRAVRNHGNQIAAIGIVEGAPDLRRSRAPVRNAWRIGQRQIPLRGHRLGRRDFQLARLALAVKLKRFLIGEPRTDCAASGPSLSVGRGFEGIGGLEPPLGANGVFGNRSCCPGFCRFRL